MAIVGFPSQEYPREEREKDGLIEKRDGELSPAQCGKDEGLAAGMVRLDRILWSAIIGGVGPRVSGKANFLAARELPSTRKTRIYRVATMMVRHSMH